MLVGGAERLFALRGLIQQVIGDEQLGHRRQREGRLITAGHDPAGLPVHQRQADVRAVDLGRSGGLGGQGVEVMAGLAGGAAAADRTGAPPGAASNGAGC